MTTPLTALQLGRLHADLHPARVSSRDQGGRQLSYLEAYDVRATLTRIFGYGNWSGETIETRVVHESQYQAPNSDRQLWRIGALCTFRITIHQTGAVYTESAAASQSGPDYGEVLDFAIKTAESDALKRAATNLGTQFGLSLYQNGTTQDVVRSVFAPDQHEIIEDLKASRGDGEQAAAARARLQARLKTGTPEGVSDAPVHPVVETADEAVSPPNDEPDPDVPPDPNEAAPAPVDHVKLAAADLARVTAGKAPRARAPKAEAVA